MSISASTVQGKANFLVGAQESTQESMAVSHVPPGAVVEVSSRIELCEVLKRSFRS